MIRMINKRLETALTLITTVLALITIMTIYSIYITPSHASSLKDTTRSSSFIEAGSSQLKAKAVFDSTENLLSDKNTKIKEVISKEDDSLEEFYGITFKRKTTS